MKQYLNKFNLVLFILILLNVKNIKTAELKLEFIDVQNLALEKERTAQPTVFVGNPFRLKVTVIKGDKNTGPVEIKGLDDFNVQGKSQHTNISMINGTFVSEISYLYDIFPDKEGNFEIGPAEIKQNGTIIKSNTLQFRVINQPDDTSKIRTQSGKKMENFQQNRLVNCELLSEKKIVYQGEPFFITLKITLPEQVKNISMEPMTFPDFTSKELGQPQQYKEFKDNKNYEIIEKKYLLIPTQTGTKTISPAKIIYQVPVKSTRRSMGFMTDDLFSNFFGYTQMQQKQTSSNKLEIDVKPLPTIQGDFEGVGEFRSFTMSTDKTTALINEAIILTLEIEGKGNFDQIATPKLILPNFIKNYESKIDFVEDPSLGILGGKKRFEYIIQVSKSGTISIPPQKFTYFDLESKTYKTLNTNEITLQIKHPVGEQATQLPIQTTEKSDSLTQQKSFIKDISFIEEDEKIVSSKSWYLPWWLFLILILFPLLFYFNLQNKFKNILQNSKFVKILSKKSTLSKFKNDFDSLNQKKQSDKLYSLFLKLFAIKFDTEFQLITPDFITQKLTEIRWEEKKINDFIDFLNECASFHFTNIQQTIDNQAINDLFKKGQYWIIFLTNEKR